MDVEPEIHTPIPSHFFFLIFTPLKNFLFFLIQQEIFRKYCKKKYKKLNSYLIHLKKINFHLLI